MQREHIVFPIFLLLFAVVNVYLLTAGSLEASWSGFGIILAAGITLALYSFLYRDNPLFKLAEHLYVGVVAAYELALVWYQSILLDVFNPLFRPPPDTGVKWLVIVPACLGLFLMTRFVGKAVWLSRISFAFFVGLGAGLAIPRRVASFIIEQIEPTILPFSQASAGFGWAVLDPAIILIGVVSVLIYFYFSVEHKGVVGGISRVGIYFLMVSFGASFGYTVMARISLLIGRVDFLLEDWLNLNPPLF
ncbi:MAG: hypothetical protein OXH06_09075 [Gemmatimonadetes bacterium]|nr:hypothetical protein [Gemmatimonadota bacterium]